MAVTQVCVNIKYQIYSYEHTIIIFDHEGLFMFLRASKM